MVQWEAFAASRPVIQALEALGVPYLVGGSLASSYHGTPRSTQDVDLVADLRPEHVSAFVARLADRYYVDAERVAQAVRSRSSFNVIYLETMFKVDVFVLKDKPLEQEEMRRRKRIDLGDGEPIAIATAEDTILQKLLWFRLGGEASERQWRDLLGILKVRRGNLDLDYLERWAERLELTELLGRARSEAGH